MNINLRAWLVTGAGAVTYLGFCGVVGRKRLLPPVLSRKLMHIGTGPIFMLCWPLFGSSPWSRWLCAAVPALAGVQFALAGLGLGPPALNRALVAAVSRSNRQEELLHGPLLYAMVHAAVTVLCWRNTPAGILALSVLCGGDGLAEVAGRTLGASGSRYGSGDGGVGSRGSSFLQQRLPHSPNKTVAGSLGCVLGGTAIALPLLLHFWRLGLLSAGTAAATAVVPLTAGRLAAGALLCSAVGAAVESVPLAELDNVTVPLAVALTSRAFFGF